MSAAPELLDALAALEAAGGRIRVVDGRLQVDVELELPDAVWQTLQAHRDTLAADLAGSRQLWPEGGPPIWRDGCRDLEPLPAPDGVDRCDRCRSTETVEQTIHGGRSVRLDCAVCGRFRKFIVWNGDPMP